MPFAVAEDEARLYCEVTGTVEPIIIVAGQASDHPIWNLVHGDFAKRYRVLVYNQRGT